MVREGKGAVPRAAHEEGLRVARLLAVAIRAQRFSVREVEEKIGWGRRTLQQVLAGRQPIRISHIAAVCGAIGVQVEAFYGEMAGLPGEGVGPSGASRELTSLEVLEVRRMLKRRKKASP